MNQNGHPTQISDPFRWVIDALNDPAMAYADWLARDIDSKYSSAVAMLTDPATPLEHLVRAKAVFKTMRVVASKSSERRLAARLYTASIAAAIARHGRRISQQSDRALIKAFTELLDDRDLPMGMRDLAGLAMSAMNKKAAS
ncbi:MAG TPA: hypothetical protein VG711_01355 [Phycisphaerales bacterium]|nr:hypothetical protein [Phycisphaerales bacterium]